MSRVLGRALVALAAGLLGPHTTCSAAESSQDVSQAAESRAASALGGNDSTVLTLIREVSEWKGRALRAESLLLQAGVQDRSHGGNYRPSQGGSSVLSSLEEERVVVLSIGREGGALVGALVTIGGGVVAKVVESRDSVSAAFVDNSYKGKLEKLEGLPVKLAVR
jgi:hypothetical protein